MTQQTHDRGAGRSRLVEEIEMMLRKEFGWNEVVMSERMWRFIGVNTEELLNYGINPHEWIEILRHLSINDTYMLGAVHGDVYVKPTMPCCYEISASTTSTMGVLYFEELMRRIRMPTVEFSTRRRTPTVIYVRFYVELSKKAWPWYEGYEIISSFNMDELRKYVSGLIDTDGSVTVDKQERKYKFEIDIASADTKFLEFLRDIIHERLGITGSIALGKKGVRSSVLRFRGYQAIQLYEELRQYLAHPMKRVRSEVFMRYYNKDMPQVDFLRFVELFKYHNGSNDPKRYRAAILLTQAAPQTHTHGGKPKSQNHYS
ncbi:MAG: LAGLIDADG family homing endonuclease [Vulcanisaeta sp.]